MKQLNDKISEGDNKLEMINRLEEEIKELKANIEKNKDILKEKDNQITSLQIQNYSLVQPQNNGLDDANKKYYELINKLQKETKEKEKIIK